MRKGAALVLFPFWVVVIFICCMQLQAGDGKVLQRVPCYFIFGDSLADNGNNNFLSTIAKVNHRPYGIDFPSGPTGRFCNGRTTVDIIAELMGFNNYIPPFATTKGRKILSGVNYASGSAGILNETGQHLGGHISMDGQLKNHQITISRMAKILGTNRSAAAKYLNKCLYHVGMGSNDFINNYFQPKYYPTSRRYTPEQYAKVLAVQYFKQLKTLYSYGARKIALFGVGPIGCAPNSLSLHGATNGSTCVDPMNNAAQIFNENLKLIVNRLNKTKTDADFVYVDGMGHAAEALSYGFKVLDAGCCQVGSSGQCIPFKTPCQNRSEYVFWDAFHPTEAVNRITARLSYNVVFPSKTDLHRDHRDHGSHPIEL
ncbi:GDSL esterase/lipase At1g29670-like [Juglans regia]|uniref:GDSL esterase/lipase At1g29670-like n=2 Tax=Juglans regia TaxID=51240 RepID=A0A2I4DRU0_JUGRE|nr:GDSL esterase/lipase At1g29670-like [Juglans regia]